jgi:RimJ/RimL family protein N-acetyltransferase
MSHLADQYRICNFFAVLKKENQRSMRLLQRLGFTLGSPAQHLAQQVERDEYLMLRTVAAPGAAVASIHGQIRS